MSAPLAVLAAFCLGAQVLVVERGMATRPERQAERPALTATLVTLCSSVAALWAVTLAWSGLPGEGSLVGALASPAVILPFLVAGVADPALTRFCYYEGIRRVGPNLSSAVTAGSPAVAAVVALAVLGQTLTPMAGAGIAVVVAGVAWLQLASGTATTSGTNAAAGTDAAVEGELSLLQRELRTSTRGDLGFPLAAMVLIGVAGVLVDVGLGGFEDAVAATAITQTAALGAVLLALGARPSLRRQATVTDRRILGIHVAAGAVLAAGWLAMFAAFQAGRVVTVLPLVSTYPLFVVVLSALAERELPRSPRVLAAMGAIVAGAALVQVG